MVELALSAEDRGFDGFFVWDHVLRPGAPPVAIADPWVVLAAVAAATSRIRLGPMVTPLARRRPQVVARQAITLDRLSVGRCVLGLGLGVDSGGELSRFGEVVDPLERGRLLDEGADLLAALFTGAEVHHAGAHFVADGVALAPLAVQRPRVPMWFAARAGAVRPARRAARFDGMFAIDVDADGLSALVDVVLAARGSLDGFDVAARLEPGRVLAPAGGAGAGRLDASPSGLEDLARRGVSWAMWSFQPGEAVGDVAEFVAAGPPG